ncbi:hypothetical protein MRQ36_29545 [Micromonospora sp. R77]|uniref:hypothetical protein n=1 Tax=Micromonospora sp. R77 TaxID=2925836 RepID=UPI001F6062C6|nr:hypothetical protein [Micromonospora sp. R77]MCI4066478.1 hypothetical protein [Micromonospora sp. R77]
MAANTAESVVTVRPFVSTVDGAEVIIGDTDRKVFLAIPAEGLDILHALAEGRTIGETAELFERKHGESADVEDFVAVLAAEGFVTSGDEPAAAEPAHEHSHAAIKRWSFDWIAPETARRLTGPAVILPGLVVILAGLVLAISDPGMLPGARALLFEGGNFAVLTVVSVTIAMIGLSLHEFAHALAARSVGVSATLGISNLMYILVAQTDISGIWLASKRARYKAFLAGFFVDAFFASLLISFLYANRHGVLHSPNWAMLLGSAALLTFLVRIGFQFFFYLRTDVYYVIAAALNCRNLMSDTERFLTNGIKRLTFRRDKVVSQAGIPRKEMRKVRVYAGFWVVGRIFSLFALVFTILPVLWVYVEQFVLLAMDKPTRFSSADFATVAVLAALLNGGGLVMWGRNLWRGWQRRRAEDAKALALGTAAG